MIGAVIQARMGSARLPGKVLKQVQGYPMLGYLVDRLQRSVLIQKIVIATTTDALDDPIVELGNSLGVDVVRGSRDDVLDRFYKAVDQFSMENVVRITGDCPLLDWTICDKLINMHMTQKADYSLMSPDFAEGLDCEVCSREALFKAHCEARLRSDREHVTLYLKNHPEMFKTRVLENNCNDSYYRITVDNLEDFEVVREILRNFLDAQGKVTALWPEIKCFLDQRPDLIRKNAHVIRNEGLLKSLESDEFIR